MTAVAGGRLRASILAFAIASFVMQGPLAAQDSQAYLQADEPKRLALVVGNANYQNFEALPGSATDAKAMKETLVSLGFDVDLVENTKTFNEFVNLRLVPFAAKIKDGDLVLFYFTGHGFGHGHTNYLVPTAAPASVDQRQLDATFLPESTIRSFLAEYNPGVLLVLLDACRTYAGIVTDAKNLGTAKGLHKPSTIGSDVLIGFAAAPGESAFGLQGGQTSHYTTALVRNIPKEGLEFSDVRREITYAVKSYTGEVQKPWFSESMTSEVFLRPTAENRRAFLDSWKAVLAEGRREMVQKYLAFNRVGPYAKAARKWLTDHPDDVRITHTRVSPLLPELAWNSGYAVKLKTFPTNLGVARTLDVGSNPAARNLSSDVRPGRLLEVHGSAMILSDSDASQTSGKIIRLPRGSDLQVLDAESWQIRAIDRDRGGSTASLTIAAPESTDTISVGRPIAEFLVGPSTTGAGSSIDPAPLEAKLRALNESEGRTIGWVSIATPKVPSARDQGLLSLQAVHAKKILRDQGVAESKISTVEGFDFPGSKVRVRIYGF